MGDDEKTLADDEDAKRLSDELRAALAPKPKKKLMKVKERAREQSRWMARQRTERSEDDLDGAEGPRKDDHDASQSPLRLVEPEADAHLRGNAGPALEPEFSSGRDAERFRTFSGASGKNPARWAFLVAPLGETLQAQRAAKGAPVVERYAVFPRTLVTMQGVRPALKVGDRPFSQVVVVGEDEGVALYFRSDGGLKALAALLEQSRVDHEERGLSPMAPLPLAAAAVASWAASLVGGHVVTAQPTDAPAAQERWRLPSVLDDTATFMLRMPTWERGQRRDAYTWCAIDLVSASLTVEALERVAALPTTLLG